MEVVRSLDQCPVPECAVTIGYMVENINRVVNRYRPALVPFADVLATKPRFIVESGRLTLLHCLR